MNAGGMCNAGDIEPFIVGGGVAAALMIVAELLMSRLSQVKVPRVEIPGFSSAETPRKQSATPREAAFQREF